MPAQEPGDAFPHLPVLYQEIIHAIGPASPGRYIDGTLGAGGHAWGILNASAPDGRLLGLDVDPSALEIARQRLADFGERATLANASYTRLDEEARALGWDGVNGIVMDLGVSSMQVDRPERGFSFISDGPLDMRFDPTNPVSAATLVNSLPERDLADLIWTYGEDRNARRIARAIVAARPLQSTRELAEVVARASRAQHGKGRRSEPERIHPATRAFQALRIAVNGELQALEDTLPKAIATLSPGGRIAVIAFHSLEDRIVKQYFARESRDCICPPEQPVCICGHKATIRLITRHPLQASDEEIQRNPRSRSAKLRVAERIEVA